MHITVYIYLVLLSIKVCMRMIFNVFVTAVFFSRLNKGKEKKKTVRTDVRAYSHIMNRNTVCVYTVRTWMVQYIFVVWSRNVHCARTATHHGVIVRESKP